MPPETPVAVTLRLKDLLTDEAPKAKSALSQIGGALKGVGRAFFSLRNIIIGGIGAVVLKRSLDRVISAAIEQEDAVNKLNSALMVQGAFSDEVSEANQRLAASLQRTSRFGDEAILSAQSLLLTYGVQADRLREATEATLDFAAATGRDLNTAALTVGKAAAGFTGELSRYGIIVETEGIPKSEVFTAVLEKMNSQFGGRAQADVETYGGRTQQLANSWGDLLEEIGMLVTKTPEVNQFLGDSSEGFQNLASLVRENREELQAFVVKGLEVLLRGLEVALEQAQDLGNMFDDMFGTKTERRFLETQMRNITAGMEGFTDTQKRIAERSILAGKSVREYNETLGMMEIQNEETLRGAEGLREQLILWVGGVDEATRRADVFDGALSGLRDGIADLRAELDKPGKTVGDVLGPGGDEAEAAAEAEAESMRGLQELFEQTQAAQRDEMIETRQLEFEQNMARQTEQERSAEALRELAEAEEEARADRLIAEQQFAFERNMIMAQLSDAERASVEAQLATFKGAEEERLAFLTEAANRELQLRQQKNALALSSTIEFFKIAGAMAQKGTKKQFDISKAAALAEAAVSHRAAIAKAAAIGFPQNIPIIALEVARMVENIRKITGTNIGGGGGGGGGLGGGGGGGGGAAAPIEPIGAPTGAPGGAGGGVPVGAGVETSRPDRGPRISVQFNRGVIFGTPAQIARRLTDIEEEVMAGTENID